MKLLINASNLHIGGGVQVAASFITELALLLKDIHEKPTVSLLYSSIVKANLSDDCDLSSFNRVNELNVYGMKAPSKEEAKLFYGFDTCFTIFGPFYPKFNVKKHVCGFAQPWIAYPNNDVYPKLTLLNRLKTKVKFFIQSHYFKAYDHLIVEQQHVKDALLDIGYLEEKISVVSNCVSNIYDKPQDWIGLDFDKSRLKYGLTLGFVGRPYTHKNIEILKKVDQILCDKYKLSCNFIFTFTSVEMKECGFSELDNFFSVGSIRVEQCPAFYQLLDALVFPSLLECFSAAPIEAMKMNTTVLSSNYPFVTEVCQDAAFYFDGLDAYSIAESIVNTFTDKTLIEKKRTLGRDLVKKLPTAKDRALAYFKVIYN